MSTAMDYTRGEQWLIGESRFCREQLGKVESVFSLGNGYMGLRSATEEGYLGERRGLFVAGCFNCANENEVTELPNGPDVLGAELTLNGCRFALDTGKILSYDRTLNLRTGELRRSVTWEAPEGAQYQLDFSRFVSRARLPLIGQKITLRPISGEVDVVLRSGLNGQMTNSGAQHFLELQKRSYDRKYLQYTSKTNQSAIDFVATQTHLFQVNREARHIPGVMAMGRRKIFGDYALHLNGGDILVVEKLSTIHTSRDKALEACTTQEIQEYGLAAIREVEALGYDALFAESKALWEREWAESEIQVTSENPFDQLAIRFAQYHLSIMTPSHDDRMSVGAKGLSGEGYKGHTFWDCDQFVLPYFTFTQPEKAKSLCSYRYNTLPGARKKAEEGGFQGAQFPWESAWVSDGEVTPALGDADLVTGLPQVIWTGKIEQHITADVVYGIWQYVQATGDAAFLREKGYPVILETARFWCSRLEEGPDGRLHLNDVIGPDEYKEHVNDNAYTNYMAWWNMTLAKKCLETLGGEGELQAKLADCIARIYLPQPDETGLMAQDATYLTLRDIDLTKYKNQDYVLGIYKDYNAHQLNSIQVSKQADILILFYLLENLFDEKTKAVNYRYYEARTLHDSSLSLSTHCILASDLDEREQAYGFFRKASEIDLGPNMRSSDEGIHSASIGGIWQSLIFGLAGVRLTDGVLRIRPRLPKAISRIAFPLWWQGERLKVMVEGNTITIHNTQRGTTHVYTDCYQSR